MLLVEARIVIRKATLVGRPAGETTLVIEGRHIHRIVSNGERLEACPSDWEVEADGRLVVPGGVDLHTHLTVGALQRLVSLPERPLTTISELRSGFRTLLEDRLQSDEIEALTAAGALAALRSGVTCVFDLCRSALGHEEEVLPAVARGVSAIGLRAALACAVNPAAPTPGLAAVNAFAASVADSSMMRGMLGLDGLAGTSHETLMALHQPAYHLGLHASIGEDEADLGYAYTIASLRPLQLVGSAGLLGPRTIVAHGGTPGNAEAIMLFHSGACVVVTPRAALLLGIHLPSIDLLSAREVMVALGTDGLYPDLAGEALVLLMLLRRKPSSRPQGDLVGHVIWPTGAEMATRFFGEKMGVLEEGALADVVVLDWRPSFPLPAAPDGDLALLWAGVPAAWAIVDGQVRLREGRLLGADEGTIAARARQAAARVLS